MRIAQQMLIWLGPGEGGGGSDDLAQLGERRSAEREAVSSNPGRTNTQGL